MKEKIFLIEYGVGGGVNDMQEEFIIAENYDEAINIASENAEQHYFDVWEETLCSCKDENSDEEFDEEFDEPCQCVDSWVNYSAKKITEDIINDFSETELDEYNKFLNSLKNE